MEILNRLHVLVQFGGPEDHPRLLTEHNAQKRLGQGFVTDKGNIPDPILAAFIDPDRNGQLAGGRIVEGDLVFGDFHIQITLLAVEIAQFIQILVKLIVFQPTAAHQPGKHMPDAGIHFLFQPAGLHMVIADKLDARYANLGTLTHLENNGAESRAAITIDGVVHLGLIVSVFLIEFVDFLRIVFHLALIQGSIQYRLDFSHQFFPVIIFATLKADRKHAILGRGLDQKIDRVAGHALPFDLNELKESRLVEGANVAIDD